MNLAPSVVIDSREPEIQDDVHFGASFNADQFIGDGDGQKEEAGLFLTGTIIVQHSVMAPPALDPVFHQMTPTQNAILDEVLLLELFKDLECLAAGTQS